MELEVWLFNLEFVWEMENFDYMCSGMMSSFYGRPMRVAMGCNSYENFGYRYLCSSYCLILMIIFS